MTVSLSSVSLVAVNTFVSSMHQQTNKETHTHTHTLGLSRKRLALLFTCICLYGFGFGVCVVSDTDSSINQSIGQGIRRAVCRRRNTVPVVPSVGLFGVVFEGRLLVSSYRRRCCRVAFWGVVMVVVFVPLAMKLSLHMNSEPIFVRILRHT